MLLSNPFYVLCVSPISTDEEIKAAADEQIRRGQDKEVITSMRDMLLDKSNRRFFAELTWLPNVDDSEYHFILAHLYDKNEPYTITDAFGENNAVPLNYYVTYLNMHYMDYKGCTDIKACPLLDIICKICEFYENIDLKNLYIMIMLTRLSHEYSAPLSFNVASIFLDMKTPDDIEREIAPLKRAYQDYKKEIIEYVKLAFKVIPDESIVEIISQLDQLGLANTIIAREIRMQFDRKQQTINVPSVDVSSVQALNQLGNKYKNEKKFTEAIEYYKKAAEQGDMDAQCSLGDCYYHGTGVEQDYPEAVKWYRKAAEQGSADAQYKLGYCYENQIGMRYDRSNHREEAKWYRMAAEQGLARAQDKLGACYHNGIGVDRDFKKAVKWYRRAADQGNASAQNHLGVCYQCGRGVERDHKEAAKWYRMAAAQGDTDAKRNLKDIENPSSGCFITTAVCQMFGKTDDCYELTMFRHFRDAWLNGQPDGKTLISEYYAIAPAIVEKIDGSEYPDQIYQKIWELYLSPCLYYLENKQYEDCKNLYIEMVMKLKKRFN